MKTEHCFNSKSLGFNSLQVPSILRSFNTRLGRIIYAFWALDKLPNNPGEDHVRIL
jgi:hypothetical protein